jgi:ankyrin repeat protein
MTRGLDQITNISRDMSINDSERVEQMFKVISEYPHCLTESNRYRTTAAHIGASCPGKEVLEALILAGAALDGQENNGSTPLHRALMDESKSDAKVIMLLDAGADPDINNAAGQTPLHIAVVQGREEIVSMLLEKGASPRAYDELGQTPLDFVMPGSKMDVLLREATWERDLGRTYVPEAASAPKAAARA